MSTPSTTAPFSFEMTQPAKNQAACKYVLTRKARIVIDSTPRQARQYLAALINLIRDEAVAVHLVRAHYPSGAEYLRGALLTNEDGRVILHVVNATIGYNDEESLLCKGILKMLGFSDVVFDSINKEATARCTNYAVSLELSQFKQE